MGNFIKVIFNKYWSVFYKPDPKKTEENVWPAIIVGLFAAFGGILFGYDTGSISGVMEMNYVLERFPEDKPMEFSSSEHSLIVSILSAGTFFGALSAPFIADTLGRKWVIVISSLFTFNLGIALQTAATTIGLLAAGRVIAGFGLGFISATIPLYQSETVPKSVRGAIVSVYQLAITIGIFLASCVEKGTHNRNDSGSYRIPIALQFAWALILGIGMIFLPETPRFYISKNKEMEGKESLSKLRKLPIDHPELLEEYDEIKANYDFENSFGSSSWPDVFKTGNSQLKRIFTGTSLQAFQQLTGINFIFYYGTTFFGNAGIKDAFTVQVITNLVNVFMTFPGIYLVEVVGRRALLIWGAAGMCLSGFVVAIVGEISDSDASNKALVAFACIFIAFFASSWGPVCWVVTGEIYPLRVRGKSVALTTASNWLWNFAIAYATPYMIDSGPGNANLGTRVYFIWGGCNVLAGIFAYCFIYETKNLSLEEIDETYQENKYAWRSTNFKPKSFHENIQNNMIEKEESFISKEKSSHSFA
ncbi:sugar porter family MFS transporter [Ascoidea rubescens DSM 1968]|uniref:Glucose transporter/sensor n=1 Tax=Ascoidea rubescens DSM 1968 TaxID=1344418 RepID=A0A1D2VBW4_9ASCO|nr:glucose transporter/sensor [Ascoidea rubescens DSM 1968]ODV58957.1 glucose transporter/sensor [Ascoidea rubescens DSM 1968]